jgi:hypothetical protein
MYTLRINDHDEPYASIEAVRDYAQTHPSELGTVQIIVTDGTQEIERCRLTRWLPRQYLLGTLSRPDRMSCPPTKRRRGSKIPPVLEKSDND